MELEQHQLNLTGFTSHKPDSLFPELLSVRCAGQVCGFSADAAENCVMFAKYM